MEGRIVERGRGREWVEADSLHTAELTDRAGPLLLEAAEVASARR
jgi:hypothetical protein